MVEEADLEVVLRVEAERVLELEVREEDREEKIEGQMWREKTGWRLSFERGGGRGEEKARAKKGWGEARRVGDGPAVGQVRMDCDGCEVEGEERERLNG